MNVIVASVAVTIAAAALVGRTPPSDVAVTGPQPTTYEAYEAYLDQAHRGFIARLSTDRTPPKPGAINVAPGRGDGITEVPGGLVHHWTGAIFVPGALLERALETSQDYRAYGSIYKAVVASKLLERSGNAFHVWLRLKGGGGGVSVVLEIRTTVEYFQQTARQAYSIAKADEIREVKNPGSHEERLLPPGDDSGYLWRGNTFTLLTAVEGGILVEMETLGLSRRFPPMLGWIIEPIARRVGRRGVEQSLREFAGAVVRAGHHPSP